MNFKVTVKCEFSQSLFRCIIGGDYKCKEGLL